MENNKESYYGEFIRRLAVGSVVHNGIPTFTNKRVQPRKDSGVASFFNSQLSTLF